MKGWTTNEKFGDWDKVTTTVAPPDPGLYRARFVSAEPQATKKAGLPALKLSLELFEDGDGNALERKRRLGDTLVLTQEAAWRIKLVCQALDISMPEDNSLESAEEFCKELITASKDGVFVRVKHRTYTAKNGEEAVAADVDRYLSDIEVSEEGKTESASSSNGAAPARRPRGNQAAGSSASA